MDFVIPRPVSWSFSQKGVRSIEMLKRPHKHEIIRRVRSECVPRAESLYAIRPRLGGPRTSVNIPPRDDVCSRLADSRLSRWHVHADSDRLDVLYVLYSLSTGSAT